MKKHDWRLDFIKIVAIIFVLYNHLYCYSFIFSYDLSELNILHYVLLIPSLLCKCGSALFFMVSGVVLLGKNETYTKIISHRVSRILIVIAAISIISGICNRSISSLISTFLGGLNWYLYAYLAFLLMLPIFRRIVQNFSDDEWKWFIAIVAILNMLQAIMIESNINFVVFSNIPLFVTPWASVSWHMIFPVLGYGFYHKRELIKQNILNIGMFLIDTHSPMREKIYGLFFDRVVDGLHGILAAWWIIIVLFVVYGIIVWCLRLIPAVKKVL